MTERFNEDLDEKLEELVKEAYELEKWLNHNDDDKQDLLWVQLYAMQSYAAALKARIRAVGMAGEGWDGGDIELNSVDLSGGYLMAIERLMLEALESVDKTEMAQAIAMRDEACIGDGV